jgi:hypothetical protein
VFDVIHVDGDVQRRCLETCLVQRPTVVIAIRDYVIRMAEANSRIAANEIVFPVAVCGGFAHPSDVQLNAFGDVVTRAVGVGGFFLAPCTSRIISVRFWALNRGLVNMLNPPAIPAGVDVYLGPKAMDCFASNLAWNSHNAICAGVILIVKVVALQVKPCWTAI